MSDFFGTSEVEKFFTYVMESLPGVPQLRWPTANTRGTLDTNVVYQRDDTDYLYSQDGRLLGLDVVWFNTYVLNEGNVNNILVVGDAIERGLSFYPPRNALYFLRAMLNGKAQVDTRVQTALTKLTTAIGDGSKDTIWNNLSQINVATLEMQQAIGYNGTQVNADSVENSLRILEGSMTENFSFSLRLVEGRDLNAPEVAQLGVYGRVFQIKVWRGV